MGVATTVVNVTPTNFVELLKGYGQIIKEKRTTVDNQRTKLRNGLSKLDDARKKSRLCLLNQRSRELKYPNNKKFAKSL